MPLTREEIIQQEILTEKKRYPGRPEGFREKYIEELVGKYGPTQRQYIIDTIYKELRSPGEPAYVAPFGTTYGVERVPRYDKIGEFYAGLDITPPTREEEVDIRERTRKEMQAQIDLIEQRYAKLLREEQVVGEERFGRARAMLSAAGILGTPMAAAMKGETREFTRKAMGAIEEEKGLRIAVLLSQADIRATEEIEMKRLEARGEAERYITYLKEKQEEIRETWSGLAEGGISLSKMKANKEYYEQAISELQMDEFSFDLWYESKLPKPQQSDFTEIQYEKDGNIWLKRIAFDPATGEKTEYNYDLGLPYVAGGIEYTTKILDDGTLLLLPKVFDPTKSLDEQIVQYGKRGEFAKPIVSEEATGLISIEEARRWGVRYGTTYEELRGRIPSGVEYSEIMNKGFTLEQAKDIKESDTAPEWFKEAARKEYGMVLSDEGLNDLWSQYVIKVLGAFPEKGGEEETEEQSTLEKLKEEV